MATPTSLPSSFTDNSVLTATQLNNLRGAFRILQVVESANDTTQRSTTSATYADSGLTLTITPQATTNKILCVYFVNVYSSAATTGGSLRLVRGSTTVVTDNDYAYSAGGAVTSSTTQFWLDAPSTTSATTYKIQYARNQGAGTVYINTLGANNTGRFIALEVSL